MMAEKFIDQQSRSITGKNHYVKTLVSEVSKVEKLTSDSCIPERIPLRKGTCGNLEFHCRRNLDSTEICLTQRFCFVYQGF